MIESAKEFVELRKSYIKEEYDRSANEEASLETWHQVILNYPEMRKWVAHNKTVPLEILEMLSNDQDSEVRWAVASKRKLNVTLQLKLAKDPDETVRARIAWNAKACKEALELLESDTLESTRQKAIERLKNGEFNRQF